MQIILKIKNIDGVYYRYGGVNLGYRGDKYTVQLVVGNEVRVEIKVDREEERIESKGFYCNNYDKFLNYQEKVDDMLHLVSYLRNLSVRRFYKYVEGEDSLTELFIAWLQEQTYELADKIILEEV